MKMIMAVALSMLPSPLALAGDFILTEAEMSAAPKYYLQGKGVINPLLLGKKVGSHRNGTLSYFGRQDANGVSVRIIWKGGGGGKGWKSGK